MRVLPELFGGGRGRVLAFCWLGWLFDFYDLILFAFVQRDVAAELDLGTVTLAWINGITLAATAVGGFWFGRIADRTGRRRAITRSILVYSAGALATSFADSALTLALARIVTGLGVGGEWGVGHAIVAETYAERWRGRAAGVLQAGSPVAMALAAVMATWSGLSWRALFALAAVPALLAFAARWAMPGADRAPGRDEGRLRDLFRGALRRPSVSILAVLVLHMTGFWSTYSWLPTQLLRDVAAEPAFVGMFFVAVNAVHVIADVAFGFLADRCGRRRVFVLFCLAFAAGLVLVGSSYGRLAAEPVLFTAAFALIGLGAGTWSCMGVLFAENYPERVRATAAAGFYNLARGAQLLAQPLLGVLLVQTGTFAVALYVGAAAALLSAVAIAFVPVLERREP